MTATRGPQVVLEGYARTVARGGAGPTMRDNMQAMDLLVSSGLVADGSSVDGSSVNGGKPYDVVVAQFPREELSQWEVPAPWLQGASAYASDTPPTNPVPGQLWFDAADPQLYVWYDDGTSAQWVIATAFAGGLTTDAPSDGTLYGRWNGTWQAFNSAVTGGPFLPLPTGGNVAGATTFSATGFPLQVPSGTALFGAGSTGGFIRVQGQAATTRTFQFTTNNVARWNITATNDAESGNNAGTYYKVDAYADSGTFTGNLLQGYRASGPLGNGPPYVRNLAPFRQNATRAAEQPGSIIGNDMEFGTTSDYQPQVTLGANPLSVTSGSAVVTVTWTGACGANGPISVATETWVNLQGAAAVGGITPAGWLKVQSIVDINTFRVNWTANATSTATGGGSAVTARASFFTTTNKVISINKTGANGFTNQTTELWAADPDWLQPVGQSIPKYLQRWHWTVGPNDTSGANGWSVTGVEWDLTNRGKDMGYSPNFGANQNQSTGIWIGPKSGVPGWVTGGGAGTNWNCVLGVFADSSGPSIGVYGALNVQPNALVGAAMDVSGHGGVGVEIFGSATILPGAPFATTSGTSTITVTTGLGAVAAQVTGNQCWFPNVITIAGVTFGGASYPITVINAQSFSIAGTGTASASTPGGGTGQWIAFANYVPYAPYQVWGSFKHGLISTNARFESGGIVETQPGNGILWNDGTATASLNTSSASAGNTDIILTPAGTGRVVINGQARMPLVVTSTGQVAVTGTTTETNLVALRIPANSMGRNGFIELKTLWTHTNSSNVKTLIVRMTPTSGAIVGGATGGNTAPTTTASSQLFTIIRNNNATNAQTAHVGSGITPFGSAGSTPITIVNDTTVDQYLNINATLAVGTETVTLIHAYAIIYYAP